MQSTTNTPAMAWLAGRVATTADARQIADAIGAAWRELDQALSPVLGRRGVAALYKRSLHLNTNSYPWLAQVHGGAHAHLAIDGEPLQAVLAERSEAEAAEAGTALIHTFTELLMSLIGASLGERLLGPVWNLPSTGGTPAQDTQP
jgi:hypothetical protein